MGWWGWLSLRGAMEALLQWCSQPCTSVVLSSLSHQPARPQDTDHAGHRASLLLSLPPSSTVCSQLGPGCPLAKGPGEGGCPLPLPHCPGTWGATHGSSESCAGALSERFAHGKNLGVSSPMLPPFPSKVCCPRVTVNGGPPQGPVLQAQAEGNTSGVKNPSQGRGQHWSAAGGTKGCSALDRSRLSVVRRNVRAGESKLHISSMYIIFRRGRGESLGPLITLILLPLDCWLCM